MPSQSAASCYAASCASFRQLWFVSVDSQNIYLECCQLAHWTVRTEAACKLFAATVTNRQQLAQRIADIVLTQSRFGLSPQLRENISIHEKLLVNMFPCLNPFSARAIMSRSSLVQFLRLDQSNISSLFPWLPENQLDLFVHDQRKQGSCPAHFCLEYNLAMQHKPFVVTEFNWVEMLLGMSQDKVAGSGNNQLNCTQLVSLGKGSLNTCEDVESNPGPGR